jgi:hypothetical protein
MVEGMTKFGKVFRVRKKRYTKGVLKRYFPALKCACQPGLHLFMINSRKAEKPDHGNLSLK